MEAAAMPQLLRLNGCRWPARVFGHFEPFSSALTFKSRSRDRLRFRLRIHAREQ